MIQPGTVERVRVFEAYYVTILHRGTINSVPGEDLERDVVVGEPAVPCQTAGSPVKMEINKSSVFQVILHLIPTHNLAGIHELRRFGRNQLHKNICVKI